MQRRHNCSPAASFANCVMTLYLLKVHLQTFLSVPITQKCQILSCDTLVASERHVVQNNCIYCRKKVPKNLNTRRQTMLLICPPHKLDMSATPALCKSLSLKICVFQVMEGLRGEGGSLTVYLQLTLLLSKDVSKTMFCPSQCDHFH